VPVSARDRSVRPRRATSRPGSDPRVDSGHHGVRHPV